MDEHEMVERLRELAARGSSSIHPWNRGFVSGQADLAAELLPHLRAAALVDAEALAEALWSAYWVVANPSARGDWSDLSEREQSYWRAVAYAALAELSQTPPISTTVTDQDDYRTDGS